MEFGSQTSYSNYLTEKVNRRENADLSNEIIVETIRLVQGL